MTRTYSGFRRWLSNLVLCRGAPERLERPTHAPPPITKEMRQKGLTWRWFVHTKNGEIVGGDWAEVCDFCGGNCGQCGVTGRVGNVPFDMDRMWRNAGMDKFDSRVHGLPRRRR